MSIRHPVEIRLKEELQIEVVGRMKDAYTSQVQAAVAMGVDQPKIWKLYQMNPSLVSMGRLLRYAERLGFSVSLTFHDHPAGDTNTD